MSEWSTEFPPSFDVGDPSGGHLHFDANGMTVYDGAGNVAFTIDTTVIQGVVKAAGEFYVADNAFTTGAIFHAGHGLELLFYLNVPDAVTGPLSGALLTISSGTPDGFAPAYVDVSQGTLRQQGQNARGVIGQDVFGATGAVSALTVASTIGPLPVYAGRRYRGMATSFDSITTVAGDRCTYKCMAGAVVMGGPSGQTVLFPSAGANGSPTVVGTWVAPADGVETFTFTVQRVAGTGTVNVNGGEFTVEVVS